MFDAHYDLLTIAYVCYLKKDFTKLKEYSSYFNSNNVTGLIANLYFMSKEEMLKELHPNYYKEDISVLEMFKIAKKYCEKYLDNNIKIIYSIEGCDYIKDTLELKELYEEGLRSIILTWNNENKYGSGNRSTKGLTFLGKKFIKYAIDLGIGIDLSHANKKTFYDIIDIIKEEKAKGKQIVCYASHSNARKLCDRNRNLDDKQILAIKDVDGLIGIFSHKNFVTDKKSIDDYSITYLNQITYVIEKIKDIHSVMLSTDDMAFQSDYDNSYLLYPIFNYSKVYEQVKSLLKQRYNEQEIKLLLFDNANGKIIKQLI